MAGESPDVRVRLSAEGVDEVVRALQKISGEAKKVGGEGGKGVSALNSALGILKGYIPAITFAGITTGLVAMTKSAFGSAKALDSIAQKTGFSIKTLSVFQSIIGKDDMDTLSKGLVKFDKAMGSLNEGSSAAGDTIRKLFGSFDALNNLPLEQKFLKISQALAKMPAGEAKTKAILDIFGRSGAELIPFLNKVGLSFDEFKQKAQAAGLIMDEDFAKAAKQTTKNLAEINKEVQGATTQLTAGLAPVLANVTKALNEATTGKGEGMSGLRAVGDAVGWVVKAVTTGFMVVGKTVGYIVAEVVTGFENMIERAKLLGEVLTTSPTKWGEIFKKTEAFNDGVMAKRKAMVTAYWTDLGESLEKIWDKSSQPKKSDEKGEDVTPGAPDIAAISANLALLRGRIDNELALLNKTLSLGEEEARRLYDKGLLSLRDYYQKRMELTLKGVDAEIKALQDKKRLAAAQPANSTAEGIKKRQEIEAIDSQIAQKRIERTAKSLGLQEDQDKSEEGLAKRRLEIEQQVMEAQGRTYEAAIARIQAQAAELRKSGVDPSTVSALTTALTNQARLKEAQGTASLVQGALGNEKAKIDNALAGGQMFPFQALEAYRGKIMEAIPALRELADEQARFAKTDEEIQAVERFRTDIDALAVSADRDAQEMAAFKANVESALTADLTNFFTTGIEQAESFGDAMRGLALSVVDSLRQIAAQMLANMAIQQLLNAVSGSSGGGLVGGLVGGHATGGYVSGPGSGTSDSIPARLSNGEFVVRSAVVRQPGILQHLVELNNGTGTPSVRSRGSVPRFAEGGLVTAQEALGSGASIEASFGIEEGVIVKELRGFMKGPEGQRIQIENLSQNQKRATRALGRG